MRSMIYRALVSLVSGKGRVILDNAAKMCLVYHGLESMKIPLNMMVGYACMGMARSEDVASHS